MDERDQGEQTWSRPGSARHDKRLMLLAVLCVVVIVALFIYSAM